MITRDKVYHFYDDFEYVMWKEGDMIYSVPMRELTDEEKQIIYEAMASQGYA